MADPRPQSVAEAVVGCKGDLKFFLEFSLPELVDVFNESGDEKRQAMFSEAPLVTGIPELDAWAAAAAEYLCRISKLPIPKWTERKEGFQLDVPWFPPFSEYRKMLFLAESPTEFRRRMIFVDQAPLRRA